MKKYIIGFIFGLIIAGTISVSAYNLLAKDVSYTPSWTKENGESINNVKDAIDELYNKSNNSNVISYDSYAFDLFCTASKSKSFSVPKNTNHIKVYIVEISTSSAFDPSVSGSIIESQNLSRVGGEGVWNQYASGFYLIEADLNSDEGDFTLNLNNGSVPCLNSQSYSCGKNGGNIGYATIIYEK